MNEKIKNFLLFLIFFSGIVITLLWWGLLVYLLVEQKAVNSKGGPKGGNLENLRNPIAPKYWNDNGIPVEGETYPELEFPELIP